MFELIHEIFVQISLVIYDLGYIGIFLLMFLESSFFPFPSEIVMIPAGYLASIGKMNLALAVFFGVLGSLFGALFNYYIARKYGYEFLYKYGKYLLISHKSLDKVTHFFEHHGLISTFVGRLLPGIRQYISLPAGIAKIEIFKFSALTTLGAFIWVFTLAIIGFIFGNIQDVDQVIANKLSLLGVLISLQIVLLYVLIIRLYKNSHPSKDAK